MGLVSMKEMLEKARLGHYAVGQFNINNLEWTGAILDEVQKLNAPVILGVSEGAARYMGGYNTIVGMADEDDGKFMTASAIVAYTLDGKSQILVNKENMAIYPYAVEGKIVFSNAGGEVYLMNVK